MPTKRKQEEEPPSEIGRRRAERREAEGRRSDERWQDVLTAAAEVFRRLGYSQARLEDVAQEVGISRATLYYYVGTKEELLVALLEDPIAAVTASLKKVAAEKIPAEEKLVASLREYLHLLEEHPTLFIFLSENIHKVMSGPEADEIRANADSYGRVLTKIVSEGMKSGEFRDDIRPQVAVLGIIGMFNWMHRWYVPSGKESLSAIGEDFVTMSLAALQPPK
ncbi:MAG: Transcriptional regulator, TetR family [Solirubrobacterales bacterium]|nr:Transcriptional regulator, TetR family [Solirubrobacterales bacterium]